MKQHHTHRRRLSKALTIVLFVVILLIGLFAVTFKTTMSKTLQAWSSVPNEDDFQDADFEAQGKWYGLCGKNTIHSIDDFRKTVSEDPALKTHFAGFNWEKARMGTLPNTILAYVYFKKDGNIFRKKKPIKLLAGDEYITDGNITLRTHCCNTYEEGPPPQESIGSQTGITTDAPTQRVDNQPSNPHASEQPRSVPEPGMALLAGVGIAVFCVTTYFVQKDKTRRQRK